MIYSKHLFAALLVAVATTCEAEYTRHSRTVRGSSAEDETSRLLSPASGKGGKSKKGFSGFTNPKKGEKVCLVEETTFLIEGSTTAIPSVDARPLAAGISFPECNALFSVADKSDFYKCLEEKGVINGPWFFHRDTPGSEFRFAMVDGRGSVCSKIIADRVLPLKPKAEVEFFSEEFFGTKLADFVSFSVDYKLLSQSASATKQYFVNMYVRTDPSNNVFYDCNFGFFPDDTVQTAPAAWKTFQFDLNTPLEITTDRGSTTLSPTCASFNGKTLKDFIAIYPNAVVGVGNGDTETINLVTGETGSTYTGLEVCWDNAQVTTKTEKFVYDFEPVA